MTRPKRETYVMDLLLYDQGPLYRNQLCILTDQKTIQFYKIQIKENDDVEHPDFPILHAINTQKLPSKHFGHTILQLGCGEKIVNISRESFEYWDLARKKRLGLFHTHFG